MHETGVRWAQMHEPSVRLAHMQESDVRWAHMHDTGVRWYAMHETGVRWDHMHETGFRWAHMHDNGVMWAQMHETYVRIIMHVSPCMYHHAFIKWGHTMPAWIRACATHTNKREGIHSDNPFCITTFNKQLLLCESSIPPKLLCSVFYIQGRVQQLGFMVNQ
jgi:hypothetical protein